MLHGDNMQISEREQAVAVLKRISAQEWREFWESSEAADLRGDDDIARQTLAHADLNVRGAPPRPIDCVLDLLGDRLMSDKKAGAPIRRMIIRAIPQTQWTKLAAEYRQLNIAELPRLHGNVVQHGAGALVMAEYWRQGGRWARAFCEITGLPGCLAENRPNVLPADEEVISVQALPPLHDFQLEVYIKLRELLANGTGSAGLLSLPTGAGKTRVAVEALVDHLAQTGGRRNIVIWIAQSEELQRQAWECFREVWQTPPQRADELVIPRRGILKLVRAWGSRNADDIEFGEGPTVVLANIQQLGSWLRKSEFFDRLQPSRLGAVVVDEAHRIIAPQHRDVLVALGVRAEREWRTLRSSAPVIGLTATPWRTLEQEDGPLRNFFDQHLLTPRSLSRAPISSLQRREILAAVVPEKLYSADSPAMTTAQRESFEQFHELPNDYLATLGRWPKRNGAILRRLVTLPGDSRTLVFACSVEHASVMTLALNRAFEQTVAALVTGKTPRSERLDTLNLFRAGELRYLCNVGVLTTGFDAPKVDVVCLTRPTSSALLYEQMVGRGLRGPKNGGTKTCLVLDVQDEGLPDSIMSYARVAKEWGA